MSEHDEQSALFAWAALLAPQYPALAMMYAIPNGAKLPYRIKNGKRWSPEAQRLKAEGLRPGVPDWCLPVPRGVYHGLYCEMKWRDNKPTPEQEWWLDRLMEYGYLAVACWGAHDASEVLCEYLDIPKEHVLW